MLNQFQEEAPVELVYYVYILYSRVREKYYIGQTSNLERRLKDHNSGFSKYTRSGIPWELVYFEKFSSRSEACLIEQKIKKMKSTEFIERLISSHQPG